MSIAPRMGRSAPSNGHQDVTKPDINALTRELRESVVRNYDDWKDDWFKSVFLSHEQVLEVNGESTSEGADEDEVVSATVAPCQAQRTLKIAHFHENVKKTPIPSTRFEVQEKDEGWVFDSWETVASGTTDANGLAEVTVSPGKEYRVVLSPDISSADMDTLYSSYDGFIESCCGVLQQAWDGGINSRWENYLALPEDQRSDAVYASAVNGVVDGFSGVVDDLKRIYDVICGMLDYDFSDMPDDLASQFEKLKEADDAYLKACLVANDEIFLFIVLYTVRQYFRLLTPTQLAEVAGELVGQILFDVVVGLLITGGLGLATKYGARVGSKAAARVVGRAESDAVDNLSLGDFMASLANGFQIYMDDVGTNHRRLQFAGDGNLSPSGTVTGGALQRQHPAYASVASDDRAAALEATHQRSATVSERDTDSAGPNEDSPSSTDQGDATQDIESTAHCGDPVSTVTGEEVLELVDARLEGPLPFEFKRVYRSGSSDRQLHMGYGWRHSLNHSLTFDRDGITWHDHEGKNTRLPSLDLAPFASNAQAGMAAWRDGNTIVACAGEKAPRYHFERHGDTGRLVRISDRYGNALRIDHDMHGRVQRIISGADQALAFEYQDERLVQVDLLHRELTHDGPAWSVLQTAHRYVYDDAGDLVEATNAAGETERYAFDNHMLTRRTLASGYSFHLAWDEATPKGRCVHQWGDSPEVDTRFAWDDEKHTCTVTYADGSEEHWQYDGAAQLQTKIDPDGAEHLNEYDDQGRLTASIDPLGAKTTYSYDDSGRLMSKVGPDDQPIQFAYKQGRIASIHRRGQTWQFAYTAEGDLARETDPKGRVTAYHYNRQGQLSQVELPDGRFHTWQWNDKGQLLEERTPTGAVEKYRYDAFGRLLARKDARGAITQYVHDSLGRVIEERLSGNRSRRYAYNSFGKVTRFTDEQGRETRYEYDRNLHLLSRRINPDGSELRYRYDHHRFLLTQIENERGETYRIDYYPNGLVRQETAFDGRRTGYSYDLNGHLLEKTEYGTGDEALQTTVYERDPLGQLSKKILPDGREIAYAYNPDGQLTGVDDGHWPLAFQYDEQGLLRTEHQGWATLQYHYDDVDRLTGLTLPDGQTLGYERDAAGLLAGINLNSAVLTRHRLSSTGEEMERQQGALFSAYEYDDEGRLTQHRLHQQKAQGILQQRDYRYDTSGNLQSISDSRKGLREYVYDPRDRLTGVRGDVYERLVHDPAGNLLEQTESAAGPAQANVQGNRLTMHGDCHYEYDDFGNLIAERRGKDQRLVTTYRYDCEHRLVEVTRPDGLSFRYEYDAFGRRIAKESDYQRTEFVWQGDRLIAEEAGDHYRTYLYEPDSFRPLALAEGYGPDHSRVYYYQLDHLGTPQEMTDANGQLVWSATYRAYGNVLRQDVAVVDNPLRFQGQYYDPETGLHYNRHRYYNPTNGRFMTPDPIGLAGGLNNYQYVPNPTGWVDPLGLACKRTNCPERDGSHVSNRGSDDRDIDPPLPSRRAAFREAKRDLGIPQSQNPEEVNRVPLTDSNGHSILGEDYMPVMTREYIFRRSDNSQIVIQDHSAGHEFGDGGAGDQGPHFNVRPIQNTRTGSVSGTRAHYEWSSK
ncbi:RHS repeat-associated core domain-containing protein [Marinobacter sp. JSM 1782161]|uniref:RHS repeat-associated core domain-containing protein n=1 Tax=Marinobacter sp. JSM 1782161 TaxID=2685906 RepID=UPI0014029D8E|nr:RHS repeat-associated core domain-containing protein [Marinobacter sp. JSM 1782161]